MNGSEMVKKGRDTGRRRNHSFRVTLLLQCCRGNPITASSTSLHLYTNGEAQQQLTTPQCVRCSRFLSETFRRAMQAVRCLDCKDLHQLPNLYMLHSRIIYPYPCRSNEPLRHHSMLQQHYFTPLQGDTYEAVQCYPHNTEYHLAPH